MHKTFWFQLHWLFGVIFGLFLILVGVSGAVLSYEKEILRFLNNKTYFVEVPQDKKALLEKEILEFYQEKNPDIKINSISFSSQKDASVSLNIVKEGERKGVMVYLNPYTAEVLPEIIGKDFFMFFFSLHRWLTFEGDYRSIGKNIVAITTIVCIFLTIGGIIVYWPQIKKNFLSSLQFSFRYKKRAFLSSSHSAIGLWVVPFFLVMCLTGLYWSYDWYRAGMYSVLKVEAPKRGAIPNKQQDNPLNLQDIQKAVDIFKANIDKEYKNANIRLSTSKSNIFTISYLYKDSTHFRETNSMEIDIKEDRVIKNSKFEDKKLNEKIMSSMLPLHSGEYFGWFGQFAMFISSLFMAFFVITGYMLYYDRWKKKKEKFLKNMNSLRKD